MKKTKILDAIMAFVFAVVVILFINTWLFAKIGIAGMGIAEALLVAAPLVLVVLRRESIAQRFNLKLPSIGSFFSSAVFMIGATMWGNAATYIYLSVFGMPEQNDMVFLENFFSNVDPAVALIIVALIPAVCEELLFRGYIFNSFVGKRGKVAAVILSSVLFSLLHFDAFKTVPLLIMALAFGYITAKTDSVLIPMIFHFINNSMSVISFYATRGQDAVAAVESLSAGFYISYAVMALGMGAVLVYFGSRLLSGKPRKKWKNIVVPIVSGVLATIGIFGLISSMMSMPYVNSYKAVITEDTTFSESFTLEEDSYGVISASVVNSAGSPCSVTVTGPDGEEVYSTNDPVGNTGFDMKKGEYTVTYSFEYKENKKSARFFVKADVVVITTTAVTLTDSESMVDAI